MWTLMNKAAEAEDRFCSFFSSAELWYFRCFMMQSAVLSQSGINTSPSVSLVSSSVHSKRSVFNINEVEESGRPVTPSSASFPSHAALSLSQNTNAAAAATTVNITERWSDCTQQANATGQTILCRKKIQKHWGHNFDNQLIDYSLKILIN